MGTLSGLTERTDRAGTPSGLTEQAHLHTLDEAALEELAKEHGVRHVRHLHPVEERGHVSDRAHTWTQRWR